MRGGIYSQESCALCGGKFIDNNRNALTCPKHPGQKATSFCVRFGRDLFKRFSTYEKALRFLNGIRFETDQGKFDLRDYQKDEPLGISNLIDQYLTKKEGMPSYRQIRYHLEKASDYFRNKNVKLIGYAEIDDFITDLPKTLSNKSKKNILISLRGFFTWLRKRKVIKPDQITEYPVIEVTLGWRKLIDKPTQQAIIAEIKQITTRNPKIHLGIKWLATYFSIRPSEMLNIKEGDFDFHLGGVLIRKPKEKKPKFVPMLPDDLELVRSYPRSLPHLYFFRHDKGYGGVKPGSKMGRDCLWKAWHKACLNLGIQGVDLYGGTKHSSITDLKKYFSPEKIKKASRIATNEAMERYLQFELADSVEIYRQSADTPVIHQILPFKKDKDIK